MFSINFFFIIWDGIYLNRPRWPGAYFIVQAVIAFKIILLTAFLLASDEHASSCLGFYSSFTSLGNMIKIEFLMYLGQPTQLEWGSTLSSICSQYSYWKYEYNWSSVKSTMLQYNNFYHFIFSSSCSFIMYIFAYFWVNNIHYF